MQKPMPVGRPGMVTRGPDQTEGSTFLPAHDKRDRLDARPGRQPGRQVRPGEDPGVGVEHAAARGFQLRDHLLQIFGRMNPPKLAGSRLAHRAAEDTIRQIAESARDGGESPATARAARDGGREPDGRACAGP